MLNRHGILIETIRERWVGEKRYRVLCETREIGSECVTARKEEKVRHVSPFLLTQRQSSVAPLVPRFALKRQLLTVLHISSSHISQYQLSMCTNSHRDLLHLSSILRNLTAEVGTPSTCMCSLKVSRLLCRARPSRSRNSLGVKPLMLLLVIHALRPLLEA